MQIIGILLFFWIVGGSTLLFGLIGRGDRPRPATEPVRVS